MTFVQRINEEMVRCGARTVDQEQAYSLRYLGETQGWLQGLTGTVRHSICVQPFEHPVRVRVWFNTSRVTFIRAHLQEWLAVPQIRRKTYSYADFYLKVIPWTPRWLTFSTGGMEVCDGCFY